MFQSLSTRLKRKIVNQSLKIAKKSPICSFLAIFLLRSEFYHFKSIEDLFSNARQRFLNSIACHRNETLQFLSHLLRETEEKERSRTP